MPMTRADGVRSRIVAILTEKDRMSLQLDASRLTDETLFDRDLALDSMQQLEFCMALEETFGLSFDAAMFETRFDRLGSLVDYIVQNSAEGP